MNFYAIGAFATLNDVDDTKVSALVDSMLANGWQGCPILYAGEGLITGSHRLEALKRIASMCDAGEIEEAPVLFQDVAEDVSDLVDEAFARYLDEYGFYPNLEYDNIGWIFAGTWVEDYKDELIEW